jgi:hypothetical protein
VTLARARGQRSVAELFGDLTSETTALVRHEVRLVTMELSRMAACAGKQALFIAAGATLGTVSLLCFIAALVLGLGTVIPTWVSALVIAVLIGAAAYAMSRNAIATLKAMDPAPKQTVQSIKEGKQWIHELIR